MKNQGMWNARQPRGARAACATAAGLLLSLMAACGGGTVQLGIRGYMHDDADDPVRYFKIDGVTGAMPDAGDGPGKGVCCVTLPLEWRPGLTATVEFGYGLPPWPSPRVVQVPVEEYRGHARGTLQAHFYPGGRVRIVVSRFAPGHPRYPLLEGVKLDWGVYRNYCALRPSDAVCLVLPKEKDH
ncbi:DUF3304 domain-containing protein [Variovorax boronicumulans]|uniref:DUF3304 domain-containing protein n=1 Tax=Variovorax boronicumulans TaxID=436515 RepID=UPI001C593DD4